MSDLEYITVSDGVRVLLDEHECKKAVTQLVASGYVPNGAHATSEMVELIETYDHIEDLDKVFAPVVSQLLEGLPHDFDWDEVHG